MYSKPVVPLIGQYVPAASVVNDAVVLNLLFNVPQTD
jgi:hypothetical protein